MYVCLSCYKIFEGFLEEQICPFCGSDKILYFLKAGLYHSSQEYHKFEIMMEYLPGKGKVLYLLEFAIRKAGEDGTVIFPDVPLITLIQAYNDLLEKM